ncbi:acriflavin resistance protein [Photobacterium kishitanii]|uniref:AcrB/AcrD/AcrF family protein n=1 Tax=Photobacterium kishitanii TaxID=318456 RepID=A0AAX0YW92_9GAMM|nr:efflux RND transporter permease subunit [Photobacterium kishitanii]KJG09702.1 acriflavin resistance protein [Photobacterium kishitanii]KJG57950.1 acriflavin resistance protein [Photobacterium kishitanii]KJG61524.1 acriflavin resistance protein [Photobacterium kishitanii]KJG66333.1 acriflavin resistance protein [Photobacterium kishitanii]KJG69584.1 acriflavin resistance protein [Photobacterium kishitanii]
MESSGIIAWFTRNHVAANLLMLLVMIGGLFSVNLINKEIFPAFGTNKITITSQYTGAAAADIEQGIIVKIEQAVDDIADIKRVTAVANQGGGVVTLELDNDADFDKILDQVKQRVDAITTFPAQMEPPLIQRAEFMSNVMFLSLYGELSDRQLKRYAQVVKDEIIQQTSATAVTVTGVKNDEISIEISSQQLRNYNLTIEQVAQALQQRSLDLPAGAIKAQDGDVLVRTTAQLYQGDQFAAVVLRTNPDGSQLQLSDIATVTDGFVEQSVLNRFNQQRAAVIQIRNLPNQDATQISQQISEYITNKKAQLPQGVHIDKWADMSHYLEGRLNMMLSNMAYGGLLVFIILALFLEVRLAFWVLLGLPFCFLGTLLFMPLESINISINLLSLFGFILVLGIVVDDAIVVGESVYSEVEQQGQTIEHVIQGAKRVAVPATFGVLTTMAAFVPMLLSDNPRTEFFKAIGWVVILCLTFSLIESKLILPAHLARSRLVQQRQWNNPLVRVKRHFNQAVNRFINVHYRRFIMAAIMHRYNVLATFVGVLCLALALVFSGQLRWVFFPKLPSDYIQVLVEMNDSNSAANNIKVVNQLEQALYKTDEEIYQQQGVHVVKHSFVNMRDSNDMFVLVELEKSESLPITSFDILANWKSNIPPLVGVKSIAYEASIDRQKSDIQYSLQGDNSAQLVQAATQLKQQLGRYLGVFNIEDDLSAPTQEINIKLTPIGKLLGLSVANLTHQVRHAFQGIEVQRLLRNNEEVKVMVRYPAHERRSVGDLQNMKVVLSDDSLVPFSQVATINFIPALNSIHRVDKHRTLVVSANVQKDKASPSEIYSIINNRYLPLLRHQYPTVKIQLDGQAKEESETKGSLVRDAVLALFAIFALMAIPLRSYTQPLIIMSVIPFGIIGAIAGHYFADISLNLLSVFGILALSGVVVNDSLVLVVFINRALAQGVPLYHAVTEAGCSRFRAIVLTSLTTFFGLAPILLETSLQAQIVIPMATSLAFGILFATVVTLVLVPALYLILYDIKRGYRRLLHYWWRPQLDE